MSSLQTALELGTAMLIFLRIKGIEGERKWNWYFNQVLKLVVRHVLQ